MIIWGNSKYSGRARRYMVHKKQWLENEKEGCGQPMKSLVHCSVPLTLPSILSPQNMVFESGASPNSLSDMQNLQPTGSESAF